MASWEEEEMHTLRDKVLEAYGGEARWRQARYIEAHVDAYGLAFTLKHRPVYRKSKFKASVHQPWVQMTVPSRGVSYTGTLNGDDVSLEDAAGNKVAERPAARNYFSRFRQQLWWDDLDMCYFGNYAMWNYLAFPALLLRDDIAWSEVAPDCLEALFPESIPTHCRQQRFYVDPESGLLRQHDYTADVISRFAKAANRVLSHAKNKDGLHYTSERLVSPRAPSGKALPFPRIIAMSISDFKLY